LLIATFGPTTAWLGKTINFENGQFVLEGHGPISSADVLVYDRGGYLTWAYAGLREWVQQVAAIPQAQRSASIQTGKGGKKAPKEHRASGMVVGVPAAGASRKKTSGWLVVGYVTIAVALLFIAGVSWWLIQDSRSPATNNGNGNSSGGTAPTPAANATIAVLDGKSEGQTNDISSPFHLKAGDSIMVRYRLRRASGPVGLLVMIKLTTWSESPVEVDGVNEDKAGKGSVTWSAPEDGDYCVGVGVINAKYHVTVVKL